MTPLGKPLVFYLKYFAEMQRLYEVDSEDGEPDLMGLDNAEHVREMARTVGDTASEQAGDFLELCGKSIEDHFTSLENVRLTKKRSRTYVVKNWDWGARVYVSSKPDDWFACGASIYALPDVRITLEKGVTGMVVPWLWSRGGRTAADEIWKILAGWAHSRRGGGVVEERATIALACIPIKAQPLESFDVDRDPLIAEVIKTFARIGADQIKAIASFVAGLDEPDEG